MGQIAQQILANIKAHEDKTAFFYFEGDDEKSLSYGEFYKLLLSFKKKILEKNITPGSLVILVGENSPQWPAAYLSAHMCGLTVVHGDTRFTEMEFANIERFIEPSLILCEKKFEPFFPDTKEKIFFEQVVLVQEKEEPEIIALKKDQPMSIIFTSGTTGDPKGVMLSESNFLSNLDMMASMKNLITGKDRIVAILPFHHVYPFTSTVLAPLYLRAALIYPKSLKGEDIFGAIKKYRGTILIAVPKVLELFCGKIFALVEKEGRWKRSFFYLLLYLSEKLQKLHIPAGRLFFRSIQKKLPGFRFFACGGAKFDAGTHIKLKNMGFTILEAYGLTETSPIAAMNSLKKTVPGSIGKHAKGVDIKIDKPESGSQTGEICIKGPNVMMGYYKRPDLTADAVIDGWFHSGDLGYCDEKGNFFISGRKKEMIVLENGKNIYPEELEKLYQVSDKISELCIVLIKEEGKEHLACVVYPDKQAFMRDKSANIYQEIKFIIETVSSRLPSYQRVTRIELVHEEFPRTSLGKIRRYKVAELLDEKKKQDLSKIDIAEDPERQDPFLLFVKEVLHMERMPHPENNLETDLGLDSLAKLEFFSVLEKSYGITITGEQGAVFLTLQDVKNALAERSEKEVISAEESFEEKIALSPEPPLHKHVNTGHDLFGTLVRFTIHILSKIILKLFFRAKLQGLENCNGVERPYIIAPNHVSLMDGFAVYGLLPFRMINTCFFISIPEYFSKFPFSLIQKVGRVILTGTQDTALLSLQYAHQVLQEKKIMCVFPEGKRSLDGDVDAAKKGIGYVAKISRAPFLPVYIDGTDKLYSRKTPGFHKAAITLQMLPPLAPEGEVDDFLLIWQKQLQKCREENRRPKTEIKGEIL